MKNEVPDLRRAVLKVICYSSCAGGLKFGMRKREGWLENTGQTSVWIYQVRRMAEKKMYIKRRVTLVNMKKI